MPGLGPRLSSSACGGREIDTRPNWAEKAGGGCGNPDGTMKNARKHHWVPQFYLRGFSNGAGRRAQVYVADLAEEKVFTANIRNIAAARDFDRVEVAGHPADALEKGYAGFEAMERSSALSRSSRSRTKRTGSRSST